MPDPSLRVYKERIVFVGPGKLRDGEQHAAHPDVMGLLLRGKDEPNRVELWLRAADGNSDSEGHSVFIPIEMVKTPDQLHPGARAAVNWRLT
jgi:hypothetical protein